MDNIPRILLVDDSRTQALELIAAMGGAGWIIRHAESAESALEWLERECFDLILIDFYLPHTQGDQLCRQMRMRIDTRLTPIAILTGNSAQEIELRGLDSGADDFIAKSADHEILRIRLRALLSRKPPNAAPREDGLAPPRGRLLAVDDSRTYLAFLVEHLRGEDYSVETATSGAEALERLRAEDFDCALVDLVMPNIDGIEVCRAIGELRRQHGKTVMVLMLTAKDDTECLARALDAGADDFAGKSSDIIVIKGRIRALLRRRMLEQEQHQRLSAELRAQQLEAQRDRELREAAEARAALVGELEQSAQSLRCSKEELHLFTMAVRGSNDGLWAWRLVTREIWFTPMFKALLGYDDAEFPNRFDSWKRAIHRDDRHYALDALRQHIANQVPLDIECRLQTKQSGYRWFRIRGMLDRGTAGKPIQIAGSIRDINDLKIAQRQLTETAAALAQSNQELEGFASAASHDLRAPLRAIKNLVEWIADDLKDTLDEENRERVRLLINRVMRLDRLIEDLLQYSRAGRVLGNLREVDVGELIDEVKELIAAPPGFEIIRSADMPIWRTAIVPLQQVFRNLIGNAIKHHDRATGRIEISVRNVGLFYEFSVRDDGPGIPLEYQERAFAMFETLKPRDALEGSGMGLAIIKRAIEKCGGRISIQSDGTRGTTFVFTWPKEMNIASIDEPKRDSMPATHLAPERRNGTAVAAHLTASSAI